MVRTVMNRDEILQLSERVREHERKLAYMEGVLYTLLISLPLLVMLILRAFKQHLPPQPLFWFKKQAKKVIAYSIVDSMVKWSAFSYCRKHLFTDISAY